jgi:O-methyltransferase involved in polyketide biosynthesis
MDSKQIAQDTARTLQNYLTYQAVREIISQLSETNPPQAIWLSQYSSGKLNDGEAYLESLMLEHKDLVIRVLTVREQIAERVLEFMPAMVHANIERSNVEHRRQLLERLTRSQDEATPENLSENLNEEDRQLGESVGEIPNTDPSTSESGDSPPQD